MRKAAELLVKVPYWCVVGPMAFVGAILVGFIATVGFVLAVVGLSALRLAHHFFDALTGIEADKTKQFEKVWEAFKEV